MKPIVQNHKDKVYQQSAYKSIQKLNKLRKILCPQGEEQQVQNSDEPAQAEHRLEGDEITDSAEYTIEQFDDNEEAKKLQEQQVQNSDEPAQAQHRFEGDEITTSAEYQIEQFDEEEEADKLQQI
eukprot:4234526-Heterocapsa_arctica.AAC.1